mgnify:FL=1
MSTSSTYKLPGVYATEVAGPKLSTTNTGNPVVAFVGPAVGYLTASQRIILTGTTGVALSNTGVTSAGITLTGVSSGSSFTEDTDFSVTTNTDGTSSVARKLSSLSTAATTVSSKTFTFYTAQPTFNILSDGTNPITGGYLIKGTVTCTGFTEDTDYSIDYHTGAFTVTANTTITNATTLTFAFQWTTAEPIELLGEASYTLSHQYISENGMSTSTGTAYTAKIVSCTYKDASGTAHVYGDTPGATDGYVEDVDFTIDYDTGKIARTASSRIPTFDDSLGNLMYIEFAYCAIKSGQTCLATYNYTSSDYNDATYFDSYNSLQTKYGAPWNTSTGVVQSQISMAAYIASKNGMGTCYGVAVKGTSVDGSDTTYTLSSWSDAFDALTLVTGVDVIVPLSGDSAVWALAKSHINTMTENEENRIALIGADGSSTVVDGSTLISYAEGFDDESIWLVAPSSFKFRNPITNSVEVVPAYYAAAAVAGYMTSVAQYTPLTQKSILGFYGANEIATKSTKKNECANGLMYIDEVSSAMKILHGRTTCTDSVVEQEANIVLTKYYIMKSMRDLFSSGYVGSIINDTTILSVKSAAQTFLANLVDNNYITSYTALTVAQSSTDLTELDVSFEYVPTYAMNYIEISLTVDATSTVS